MSEKEVEVTLRLPKSIVNLLKDVSENVEEYLAREIIGVIEADLEADVFGDPKQLVKKHNLMPIFRKYGVSVSSYVEPLGIDS